MKLVLINLAALAATFGLGVMFSDQVKAFVTGIPAEVRKEALIAWNAAIARAAVAKAETVKMAKEDAVALLAKVGQAPVTITSTITAPAGTDPVALAAAVAAASPDAAAKA